MKPLTFTTNRPTKSAVLIASGNWSDIRSVLYHTIPPQPYIAYEKEFSLITSPDANFEVHICTRKRVVYLTIWKGI